MGLDVFPNPLPCRKAGIAKFTQDGKIDCDATQCWFFKDTHARGLFGTFCWYRGKVVACHLEALGETKLSERCYESMSADEAREFGTTLLELARKLRRRNRDVPDNDRPRGKSATTVIDLAKGTTDTQTIPFDEMVAEIEEAARWYLKVSGLGCGVDTWA